MNGEWTEAAACRGRPTDWFFPPNASGSAAMNWRIDVRPLALAVCARCPVREACEGYALANGEEWGIWGGVDFSDAGVQRESRQRRHSKRQRGAGAERARIRHWAATGESVSVIASVFGITERSVYRHLEGS